MAFLQYGFDAQGKPITISYLRTESIEREPQYSDDGTEYLHTKISLSVSGVISSWVDGPASGSHFPLNNLAPGNPNETPTQTMQRIQHYLEQPRQQLIYSVANISDQLGAQQDIYIQSPPPGSSVDAKNGPFPERVVIKKLMGGNTFLVHFVVTTYLVECPSGTQPPRYASWRYRVQTDIDENFMSTKTTSGKVICRADLGQNPDELRGVVAPKIPTGFKRLSQQYLLQEDGLAMMYTVVDKEMMVMPPQPLRGIQGAIPNATKASGQYIESTNNGAQRFGEIRLRLEGPKGDDPYASKQQMIGLAIQVAMSRLNIAGPVGDKGRVLISGSVQEELYENVCEVRLRTLLARDDLRKGRAPNGAGVNMNLLAFGTPLLFSDKGTVSFDGGVGGSAQLKAVAQAFQDPCLQGIVNLDTVQFPNLFTGENPMSEGTGEVSVYLFNTLPDDENAFVDEDASDTTGPYAHYTVNSRYENAQNVLQLPVASTGLQSYGNLSSVFAQVAAPLTSLILDWSAEQVGDTPAVPSDLMQDDANAVLLSSTYIPGELDLAADGTSVIYKIAGQLVYGFKDQSQVLVQHAIPPWMSSQDVSDMSSVDESDLEDGILNGASAGLPGTLPGMTGSGGQNQQQGQ